MGINSDYTQPPVTEAVFEVKFEKSITADQVEKLARKLKINHPHEQTINDIQLAIEQNKNSLNLNSKINTTNKGYWLASEDQLDKVMISTSSIAIARLAPYTGWESLYDSFVKLWKKCKKNLGTVSISRLGVRYINRIDIPLYEDVKIDLDDYLEFAPKTPKFSEHPINDYLLRVTQNLDDNWRVNISSRAFPSPLISNTSLLLDIDLYTMIGTPLADETLFELISSARYLKNSIFEKCITAKTRELFFK